ncbi:MAG: hypothetical protein SOW08_05660 [Lachnospiraceae bacterium]|nr:hypothetical protein [Lachnospiraceae bacterium]
MEKRYFTIPELVQMGFSRWELTCAVHISGQNFATQSGIPGGRGIWRINLQEYLKFRRQATKKTAG